MLCYNCMKTIEETEKECPFCGGKVGQEFEAHHLRAGTVLQNRYVVGNSLGEGGFGITYIGFDQKLQMRVAIKEYYPNGYVNRNNTVSAAVSESSSQDKKEFFDKGKEKFTEEARVLAKFCGKPGIVEVRDLFDENNTAYIVMEYLDGITLKEYIKENGGKIAPKKALALLTPVINSLKEVHKHDIIHRDISPDNIMINNGEAKLLDFGSARAFSNSGNQSLSILLKHGYAPIEQYSTRGKQGPWTDVYALCATIYKCVTGTTPDDAVDRQISDSIKPPSALGIVIEKEFEYALMKGMSVQYADRFQSIDELLDGFNGKINKNVEDDIETVHIPKNEPQNDDDVKTELLFKSDTPKTSHASETPLHTPNSATPPPHTPNPPPHTPNSATPPPRTPNPPPRTSYPTGSQQNANNFASNAETDTGNRIKSKRTFKPVLLVCALLLAVSAVIFIPKLVKQGAVGTSEPVGTPEPVETTVTILGKEYDIATTTELELEDAGINEAQLKKIVPQIKKLTNLTSLSLFGNEIRDITPLAQLTNLTELYLGNNLIRDITPLARLTNLKVLDLGSNDSSISDITPLAGLTNLTTLSLLYLHTSDLTPLAKLTNLKELYLSGNKISDITPLARLTNLTVLDLSSNEICDITPLAKHTNLNKLYLHANQIKDIAPLAQLTNLTNLGLTENQISDITPLAQLTNLVGLGLSDNQISDITPLANLTHLGGLFLNKNQIEDITPVANLTNLTELNLGRNHISDITPLAQLINLIELNLASNMFLRDVTPLAQLTNLTELNLESDISLSAVDIESLKNQLPNCNIIT